MRHLLVPLALLAAAPAAAQPRPDWKTAETIPVVMTGHGFMPEHLSLRAGVPYVLRFANRSDKPHNFNASDFFGDAFVAPGDRGIIANSEVNLDPGGRASLRIMAPLKHGKRYTFRSTRVDDYLKGYKGWIVVG